MKANKGNRHSRREVQAKSNSGVGGAEDDKAELNGFPELLRELTEVF